MTYVLITAAGIALCSLVGAVIGFLFENIPPYVEDALSGAAAGIMLCAAILGLVVPSMEFSGGHALWLTPLGIFCGAFFLSGINLIAPRLSDSIGMKRRRRGDAARAFICRRHRHPPLSRGHRRRGQLRHGESVRCSDSNKRYRISEHSRGHDNHTAAFEDRSREKTCGDRRVHKRGGRGRRRVLRLFCHNAVTRHTALRAGLRRRNDAVCHRGRFGPADTYPRLRTIIYLCRAPRLLPHVVFSGKLRLYLYVFCGSTTGSCGENRKTHTALLGSDGFTVLSALSIPGACTKRIRRCLNSPLKKHRIGGRIGRLRG